MKSLLAAALCLALAAPALALAAAPSAAKTLAGSWTMGGDGESCTLKLTAKTTSGGWDLDAPKACGKAFPRLKDAAAWTRYDDKSIGILDPQGRRIYKFARSGDGDYITAANKNGDRFTLSKGPSAKELTPKERMSGGWSVTGQDGKPRCAFTSKSNVAGTKGTLAARPSPSCPRHWKSVGWAGWSQKAGKLALLDAKGKVTHTLKKTDTATYEGETKSGDPLYFSRD